MWQADYLTVPLSSRRAASVLGSNIPHKLMGLMAKQIDHTTYNQCPVADPRTFHKVLSSCLSHFPGLLLAWNAVFDLLCTQ